MGEIRSLKKEDWDSYIISKTDWDLEINHRPYRVVFIYDQNHKPICHTLGGSIGENNHYAYPLFERGIKIDGYYGNNNIQIDWDKEPTIDDLIPFDGEAPVWGIHFNNTNYFRKNTIRKGAQGIITRNDKPFYEFGGGNMGYAVSNAQAIITKLQEHPLNFFERDWEKKSMGRKVWFGVDPAIVNAIIPEQGCVMLKPDKKFIGLFRVQPWEVESDGSVFHYEGDFAKCEYLYEKINWFRDDEQTTHFMRLCKTDVTNMINYARSLADNGQLTEEGYFELLKLAFQKV